MFTVHSQVGITVRTIVHVKFDSYTDAEHAAMWSAHPSWVTDVNGKTVFSSL